MRTALKLLLIVFVIALPVSGWSLPVLVSDYDGPGYTTGWWVGNEPDSNPATNLINSNPGTEAAWASGILGFTQLPNKTVDFCYDTKTLTNFNPGFAWEYVVIKYGHNWALYFDKGDTNLITVSLPYGISHMTFVPEPLSVSLLLLSLVGLAGLKRFRS